MLKLNNFKYLLYFSLAITFFIFLPTEIAHGGLGEWITGKVGDMVSGGVDVFLNALVFFVGLFAGLIIEVFMAFGNSILKFALDGIASPAGAQSSVVTEGWEIIKNIANSALIIGLVIIAINIILGREEGKAKKTLVNFVIVALLINFTPLICGFFIDGANIIAKAFIGTGLDGDIVNRILEAMKSIENSFDNPVFLIAGFLALLVFASLYFFVCIVYSIIFIARIVVLWILIIASPLALATKVFPKSNIARKFFPSILYWDDWIEMFIQWVIIVIPASLFLYLANISMQSIVAQPVNFINIDTIGGIVQTICTALFAYLVPMIILIVGLFITISSGGQVTASVSTAVKKVGAAAKTYAKDAGKGYAGAAGNARESYAKKREGGSGRIASAASVFSGNRREEGRMRFDQKVDKWGAKINYKKRREMANKKKDYWAEEETVKQIDKKYEEKINKDPKNKLFYEKDQKREKDEVLNKAIKEASREINMAKISGDKGKTKDLQKSMSLLLLKNNEQLLARFEKEHDISIENIIEKMSGEDIVKNIDASSLEKERVVKSIKSKSTRNYINQRGSSAQQASLNKGVQEFLPEEEKIKDATEYGGTSPGDIQNNIRQKKARRLEELRLKGNLTEKEKEEAVRLSNQLED